MAIPTKITALDVVNAGEFGQLYFSFTEDGTVETNLRIGMLVCCPTTAVQALITEISKTPDGININSYTRVNNVPKFCYIKIDSRMYIRTDCIYVQQLTFQHVVYKTGMRIYLAAPHAAGRISLEESVGVIEKIFQYSNMSGEVFFKLQTSQGYRITMCSELYDAIQVQPDEDISLLASQINTVGVGTRVHDFKLDKTGIVLAVLYFKITPFTPMGYIIRTDDDTILTIDYRDRVLPVEPTVENINVLQSYHALAAKSTDIFLHQGMALKTVDDQLVCIARAASHEYPNQYYKSTPICAYLAFNESISWRDYGFTCEPSTAETLTCSRTGKVTSTDFE